MTVRAFTTTVLTLCIVLFPSCEGTDVSMMAKIQQTIQRAEKNIAEHTRSFSSKVEDLADRAGVDLPHKREDVVDIRDTSQAWAEENAPLIEKAHEHIDHDVLLELMAHSLHGSTLHSYKSMLSTILLEMEGDVCNVKPSLSTSRKGTKDQATQLQNKLLNLGCALPRYGADGDYGGETRDAVKVFQTKNNLDIDGKVGPQTWGTLCGSNAIPCSGGSTPNQNDHSDTPSSDISSGDQDHHQHHHHDTSSDSPGNDDHHHAHDDTSSPSDTTSTDSSTSGTTAETDEKVRKCEDCKSAAARENKDFKEACTTQCSITARSDDSVMETVWKSIEGIATATDGRHNCHEFELSWDCLEAYLPHMTIAGGSCQASTFVGGIEMVTDYNSYEVGVFVYGGVSVGTNLVSAGCSVYGAIGYKGAQSTCCCRETQDLSHTCTLGDECPCSVANSYKGYFQGMDAGPKFFAGASVLTAVSAAAVFESTDFDRTYLANSGVEGVNVEETAQIAGKMALVGAGFFVTKPLTHLTKTVGVGLSLSAEPPKGASFNVASTYYKHIVSLRCGQGTTLGLELAGPACFAAALAMSPPLPGMPGALTVGLVMKIIQFRKFMNNWCAEYENEDSFACVAYSKLAQVVKETWEYWAEKGLAGGLTEFGEAVAYALKEQLKEAKETIKIAMAEASEELDNVRAAFGDVSPEKLPDVHYDTADYVGREGTYIKIMDCNIHVDSPEPYWSCRAEGGGQYSDWKETEIGLQHAHAQYPTRYYYDYNADPAKQGYGLFWPGDGHRRSKVRCKLYDKNRGFFDSNMNREFVVYHGRHDRLNDIALSHNSGDCKYLYTYTAPGGRRFREETALLRTNEAGA
eukprot:g2340.t1